MRNGFVDGLLTVRLFHYNIPNRQDLEPVSGEEADAAPDRGVRRSPGGLRGNHYPDRLQSRTKTRKTGRALPISVTAKSVRDSAGRSAKAAV